jgi:long-chain acyl-CoA synthetase
LRTDLDRKFDETLAAVIGPGGRLVIDHDENGRAFVANFPGTLPLFFKTFCVLNAQVEAMVAGDERLTFADLDLWSDRLATALVSRGIRKGDRLGIAMRNCPAWVVGYMAALKAGAIATLFNGWWEHNELCHALELTQPALILADGPRARRIAEAGQWTVVTLAIEKPIGEAIAPLLEGRDESTELPEIAPEDDATILFTSGSTGESKGALSTHRAVTTGPARYPHRGGAAAGQPAAHVAQRAAVPRHRRSSGAAQQLRRRPRPGCHAEMGCRRSPAADREREDHLFRRRADHEPRAHEPPRPRQI